MFFDLGDYRPDTPSLTSPMTRREAVLLAMLLHAILVIVYLVTPAEWFQVVRAVPVVPVNPQDQLQYVRVEPLREVPKLAKPEAPPSDLDRRAATVERPPNPTELEPFSRGNTPDKVEGAPPAERMKGPDNPNPNTTQPAPQPAQPQRPTSDLGLLDRTPKAPVTAGGLGDSLRNMQNFIDRNQNYDNQKGGQGDADATIQFDSKGVDFGPWLRRFEARVRRNWYIPVAAQTLHGRVSITFYVHRNGALTNVEIVKVSGVDSFDMAAFNALKLSNPVDPLPGAYPDDKALFTVTFLYNERIR